MMLMFKILENISVSRYSDKLRLYSDNYLLMIHDHNMSDDFKY